MTDIDLTAGPGFTPVDDKLLHLQLGRSFLYGPHGDDTIMRIRWYVRDADELFVGKVWWGPGAQGPPGHAHGGSMAAVMDEALGSACWAAGYPVVAAELTARFHHMLPLGHVYTIEAEIERVDGRKVWTRGHIRDDDGKIYTSATGLFIVIRDAAFRAAARDTQD